MGNTQKTPVVTLRARVVKGWAFRGDLTDDDVTRIRHYIQTGDKELLEGLGYERIHELIIEGKD
jgi:hypothetical protein